MSAIEVPGDLTPEIQEWVEENGSIGWRREESGFDWESFLLDLEKDLKIDLPGQMDDPVIRQIQRWARAAYREANE